MHNLICYVLFLHPNILVQLENNQEPETVQHVALNEHIFQGVCILPLASGLTLAKSPF